MATLKKDAGLAQALSLLRREHGRVLDSIRAFTAKLERLSPQDASIPCAGRQRSRLGWTEAKRQQVSERMRAFWQARRGEDGTPRSRPQALDHAPTPPP